MDISEKEKQFFECLKKVDVNSVWGVAISNVVNDPDVSRFRRLVCDLKSQAHDSKEIMTNILGQECFDNLVNL